MNPNCSVKGIFTRSMIFSFILLLSFLLNPFSAVASDIIRYFYYDDGQIQKVIYEDGTVVEYVYDSAGNRVAETVVSPGDPA